MAARHLAESKVESRFALATGSSFVLSAAIGMALPLAATDTASASAPAPTVEAAPVVKASVNTAASGEWKLETVTVDASVIETPAAAAAEAARTEVGGAAGVEAAGTEAGVSYASAAEATGGYAPAPAASGIVGIARQYAGSPYRFGGTGPGGFDCSGFTSYVYAQAGISIPRTTGAQLAAGTQVSAAEAQPGDLVWWPGHVGIYTGNGQHIAARNPAAGVAEGPVYGSPVYVRIG